MSQPPLHFSLSLTHTHAIREPNPCLVTHTCDFYTPLFIVLAFFSAERSQENRADVEAKVHEQGTPSKSARAQLQTPLAQFIPATQGTESPLPAPTVKKTKDSALKTKLPPSPSSAKKPLVVKILLPTKPQSKVKKEQQEQQQEQPLEAQRGGGMNVDVETVRKAEHPQSKPQGAKKSQKKPKAEQRTGTEPTL